MSNGSSSALTMAHHIAEAARALPQSQTRNLVAIAGPPGAGKSTVAALSRDLLQQQGIATGLVSMDGFHYDNAILSARDLLPRKGAPETFDVAGFKALLQRLLAEGEVAVPEFDREIDKSIAARALVTPDQQLVLVEGNYLLLQEPGWSDLSEHWALSVFLDVDLGTLEARLHQRWLDHGLPLDDARDRAFANDIPNAKRILSNSCRADLVLN